MEKYILLDTENNFEIIERPDEQDKLDFWYEHIGCSCIDIVDCVNNKYCLVVDDGGWLVGEPQVNSYASLMYGFLKHGQALPGKVIIGKNLRTDDGMETVGLNDVELLEVWFDLDRLIVQYLKSQED